MKRFFAFAVCLFLVANLLYAQGLSFPDVVAGPDTTVNCGDCINLVAQPVAGFETTDYTTQQIPFNPYPLTGTPILINIDDVWSQPIPIGFDFCFYDTAYSSLIISSNGVVSFDLTNAGGGAQWQINNPIPSLNNPTNCIMGPFHDIDPGVTGNITWAVYGTAPARVFVINYDNIAMFSFNCNNLLHTSQVVIFETTNVIETYIFNKPLCAAWNGGAAIHGIVNGSGTAATVVPGRNFPTQWVAQNEGWAFYPAGAPNFQTNWTQQGMTANLGTGDTLQVCPAGPMNFVATTTYFNCNGDSIVVADTVNVLAVGNDSIPEMHTDVSCFGASDGSITLMPNFGTPPYTYDWIPNVGTGATVTGLAAGVYTCFVSDSSNCPNPVTVTINEPTQVVGNIDTTIDALCNGSATGSATVSATGGTGTYTYAWSPNGSTGPVANGLSAGTYQVIITDGNGCADTLSVSIGQPPAVNGAVTSTPVTCFGGSDGTATVNPSGGTPGYTYLWLPSAQTTQVATGLPAGPQIVVVTDTNGCTDTTTVIITEPAQIQLSVTGVDVSCAGGSDGTATVVATGGVGTLTYAWSPSGGNNATATGLTAGTYTVLVTDGNGCTNSIAVTVAEPAPQTVSMFSTPESCFLNCDGNMTAVPNGGTGPYSYIWNTPNADTTQTVQMVCFGTYTVTVTDANGCQAIDSVQVSSPGSPVADAGPDVSFCEGEGGAMLMGSASSGSGAPYFYQWTCNATPCGLSCINCPNPIANPTDTTTYYLQVFDQNGCASLLDSVVVNVLPKPVVDAGTDATICGDPQSPGFVLQPTVTGFGPFTYNWTPGLGLNDSTILNPQARPDTTTIYTLIVTDLGTGCTSDFTTVDTNATVTITVTPQPIADAGEDQRICFGDTTVLIGTGSGAGPSYDYQWSPTTGLSNPSSPNPFASPPITTDYILTVLSNGCPSFGDTVTVTVETLPTIDAGPDRDYCFGSAAQLDGVVDSITFTPGMTYNWSPGLTLNDSTLEDPVAFPDVTTQYYFQATTENGCESALDSVLVTIRPSPIVDAGLDQVFCAGDSTLDLFGVLTWHNNIPPGDQQNVAVTWTPASLVLGNPDQPNVTVAPTVSTWFYYSATYDSCTATDSVLITVIPEINATAEADTSVICGGDSVLLTSSGGLGGSVFNWIPSDGLADPTSATTLAAPDTTTTYQVVVAEGSCLDTAEVTVEVIPTPNVAFISSFTEGCAPLEVSLTSVSEDLINYIWDFGDDSTVFNTDVVSMTYDEPGEYQVTLIGVNTGGCSDSSETVTFMVYDTIIAEFISDPLYPTELILPGNTVQFTDQSESAVSWVWNFGTGDNSDLQNPSYAFDQPGEYFVSLNVSNEFGCVSQVTHGPYIVLAPDLFIPNVFSPNNDGINDGFWIEYNGSQPYQILIFDRWGREIFTSRDKNDNWDGTLEGTVMPEGVYYYKLRIGDKDYAGEVTLVR